MCNGYEVCWAFAMSWLERERCIEMQQVTEYEQEDFVGHASEAGLFGHSVRLVAVLEFSFY